MREEVRLCESNPNLESRGTCALNGSLHDRHFVIDRDTPSG
jgi:hypothetical protein